MRLRVARRFIVAIKKRVASGSWPTRQLATWLCEACGAQWVDTGNGEPLEVSRIKRTEELHQERVTVEGDNRDLT